MSKRKVPKLRFPEFSGEWEERKLGEVTIYTKGYAFKSEDYVSEGIRVIRVSDLGKDSIKFDNHKIFIDLEKKPMYKNYILNKNDVIITTVGSKPELLESAVGRGIYVDSDDYGLLNQNMLKLNNLAGFNNKFIFSYINTNEYISYIKLIQRGNANQSNISVNDLLNYRIFVTVLEEQTKIADFITVIDDKIQQLTKKKELLEQYKKGLTQQIFSQQIRFKDDNGCDYPNWQEKDLKEIAEINPKSENLPNKFYYIDLGSVNNGRVGVLDYINLNDAPSRAQRVLSDNDILFQMVRPYQKNNFLFSAKSEANYVASTGYAQLRVKENYDFKFIFQLLLTDNFVNTVMLRCTGTSYPAINSSDLSTITINTPKYEEQVKIADLLTNIDDKITQINAQLEQTKLFKKSLLQQMLI